MVNTTHSIDTDDPNDTTGSNSDSDAGVDARDEPIANVDTEFVWVQWSMRDDNGDHTVSTKQCAGGSVRLFSSEDDLHASNRAMLLEAYYNAAEQYYHKPDGTTDDRTDDKSWKNVDGKWVLFDQDSMDDRDLFGVIRSVSEDADLHNALIYKYMKINRSSIAELPSVTPTSSSSSSSSAGTKDDIGAAPPAAVNSSVVTSDPSTQSADAHKNTAPKRQVTSAHERGQKLWVAWALTCCPADGTHVADFQVSEHEAHAKAWLDDRLRILANNEIKYLGDFSYDKLLTEFIGSNSGAWEAHGDLKDDADPTVELVKIAEFFRTKDLDVYHVSFDVAHVALDAHTINAHRPVGQVVHKSTKANVA